MRACFSALLVVLLALGAGCKDRAVKEDDKDARLPVKDEHEHEHAAGPHDGQLIELGEEDYHAEVVHDHDANRITFYILDSKATGSVPVEQTELELKLVVDGKPQTFQIPAAPQEGETGKTSRFETVDKELVEALYHTPGAKPRITITIDGKQFIGEFEPEEDHEGHDHEHEEDHAKE